MSLVTALVDASGIVHMVGDSAAHNASDDKLTIQGKIALKEDLATREKIVIGCTGSWYPALICLRLFSPPPLPEKGAELEKWFITAFREKLFSELEARKAFIKDDKGELKVPTTFLVGIRGTLSILSYYLDPTVLMDKVIAIGSGGDCALGSIRTQLEIAKKSPTAQQAKEVLLKAQRICSQLKEGVRPPYTYINTKGKQEVFSY